MPYKAYDLSENGRWLVGLSTDPKPTLSLQDATTRLLETDSGNEYRWTGIAWLPRERIHPVANALVVTTALSEKVLEGLAFTSIYKASVADATALEIVFITPSSPEDIYMQSFELKTTDGEIDIEVYEDNTLLVPGTTIPALNLNRTSSNTASLDIRHGAGQTSLDGDLIYTDWLPPTGSLGNATTGAGGQFIAEWILKDNSNYHMVITNNSGGTIDMRASFIWHEAATPAVF